jgi:predicted lipoprotein with Yx(FWY)xxD motif
MLLVNSRGFTVYAFSRDHGRRDVCVSIKNCTKFWPPVLTNGAPRAGRGVKRSLLGTTRIPGGEQVTYAGHPLYTYIADPSPGSTFYVNKFALGGYWPGLRASGALVK